MFTYESEDEIINSENFNKEEVVREFSVRYRAQCKEYRLETVFENEKASEEIDSFWKKLNAHDTEQGLKQFYYCNHDRAYKLYDTFSSRVEFYVNTVEHNHITNPRGLTAQQKKIVEKLYQSGVTKPSVILRAFEKETEQAPSLKNSTIICTK